MPIRDRATLVPIELRHNDDKTLTLTVIDPEQRQLIIDRLNADPDERWHSSGTSYDNPDAKERPRAFYQTYGGVATDERVGNAIYTRYAGGLELKFEITGEYDQSAAKWLAYWSFYCGVKLSMNGDDSFTVAPGESCKVCSRPMSPLENVEWRICKSCTEACDHQYEQGIGHSRGQITTLTFCGKCGQADPDWKPFDDPLEGIADALNTEQLAFVALSHDDGSTTVLTKRN